MSEPFTIEAAALSEAEREALDYLAAADCRKSMPTKGAMQEGLQRALAALDAEQDRIVTAHVAAAEDRMREAVARLVAVHATYFDLDGEPGVDDTTPEPEDVWRYDRDFRAALAMEPTT